MDGQVILQDGEGVSVRLLSVHDTDMDDTIAGMKGSKKKKSAPFDVLALFSLDPQALYAAATKSHGNEVLVDTPIQLILYGQVEEQ